MRVIGAGLGRTGTNSLKVALEKLLGAPCYHMFEVTQNERHVPIWHAAARGEKVDWISLFQGYAAGVDWPVSAYWRELSELYPESIILLSTRDPEKWWKSASETIFPSIMREQEDGRARREMIREMLKTFAPDLTDKESCIKAFVAHNLDVRRNAPRERLVEWTASDGWGPLCRALGVPVPDEPFPHTNSKAEFQEHVLQNTQK
jgi:hypothetical protein